MWKEIGQSLSETDEKNWEFFNITKVPNSSTSALWCPVDSSVLAVNAIQDVLIFKEQQLCWDYCDHVTFINNTSMKWKQLKGATKYD